MAHVESIHIVPVQEGPPQPVERIRVHTSGGLEGDHHTADVTLIEAEAIEAVAREDGIELAPGETRRQIMTRGIALNDLVGERFRVGEVELVGVELCEPCSHLQSLTKPGVLRAFVHRAGINADVVSGGEIVPGDPVERC
jgi:MOSC domain-containing protein YiiM